MSGSETGMREVEREREGLMAGGRRPLTVGLVLVMTLIAFEALAVATAMPIVERDLGGLRLYGLVFGAFMVANLVGIAVAGGQADARGPGRPFVAGLLLFAAGLALAGASPSMEALVAARVVQGFGGGAVATAVYVVIARGYSEALRPRMFAIMASAWVLPGLVGPGVSAAVAEHLSWRLVFLGLLPALPVVASLTLPSLVRMGAPPDNGQPVHAGPFVIL